jgi:mRNA interferase RelE/StbE
MYSLQFKKSFTKDLLKLPSSLDNKLKKLFEFIKLNPYEKSIKLKGFEHIYRLRLGDYRLLFKIEDKEKIVTILAIGHRKDIYKRFK